MISNELIRIQLYGISRGKYNEKLVLLRCENRTLLKSWRNRVSSVWVKKKDRHDVIGTQKLSLKIWMFIENDYSKFEEFVNGLATFIST